jgi:hypothetical protein
MPKHDATKINVTALQKKRDDNEHSAVPNKFLNHTAQLLRECFGAKDIHWVPFEGELWGSFTPANKWTGLEPEKVQTSFEDYISETVDVVAKATKNCFEDCSPSERTKYRKLLNNSLIADQQPLKGMLAPEVKCEESKEVLTIYFCKPSLPLVDTEACIKGFEVKAQGEKKPELYIQLHRTMTKEEQMTLLNAIRKATHLSTTVSFECKVKRDRFGQIKSAEFVSLISE